MAGVFEGIALEERDVGIFAWRERTCAIVDSENLCGVRRCRT
jgi:hypothetical protein